MDFLEEDQQTLLILAPEQRWFGKAADFTELRLPDNKKASEIVLRASSVLCSPENKGQALQIICSYTDSRHTLQREHYGALIHHDKTLEELRVASCAADSARNELENNAHEISEEDLQFAAHECRLLKQTLAQKQQQKTVECRKTRTEITINVAYNTFTQCSEGPYPLLFVMARHPMNTATSITTEETSSFIDIDSPKVCVPTEFPTVFALPSPDEKIQGLLCLGESQLALYSGQSVWECTTHNESVVTRRLLRLHDNIRSVSAYGDRVYIATSNQKKISVYNYDSQNPSDSKLTFIDTLGSYHHYPGKRHHNVGELKKPTFVAKTTSTLFIVDPAMKRLQLYSPLGNWQKQIKLPPNCVPTGVATNKDVMYLCDSQNQCVHVFNGVGRISDTIQFKGDAKCTPVACVYARGCLVVLDDVGALYHINLDGDLLRRDAPPVGHTHGSVTVCGTTEELWFQSNMRLLHFE